VQSSERDTGHYSLLISEIQLGIIHDCKRIDNIHFSIYSRNSALPLSARAMYPSLVNLNTSAITPAKVKNVSPRTKCCVQKATSHLLETESNIQTHHYQNLLIQANYKMHITVRMVVQMDNRI
jgi:hypothetical protein